MPKQAETLRELAKVRADNRELLNSIVGTQGTAHGRKNYSPEESPDGEPCVIVYMPHKLHSSFLAQKQQIPQILVSKDNKLEALTDVVVTTMPKSPKPKPTLSAENQALVRRLQWRDGHQDRLVPGVQLGGFDVVNRQLEGYFGTLGYCVRSNVGGMFGLLTNQHVGGEAGQSIYIPGGKQVAARIGITRTVREHYPDEEWMLGVNESFAYVRSDAAFIAVEQKFVNILSNDVPGVGAIAGQYKVDFDSLDIIGMHVSKVGRTTGLTAGIVVAYGYGIAHTNEIVDRTLGVEPANIYTDFLIAPAPDFDMFSAGGDSGSAIIATKDDDVYGLGLLWGGWPMDIGRDVGLENLSYGIDLNRLLTLLDLHLM